MEVELNPNPKYFLNPQNLKSIIALRQLLYNRLPPRFQLLILF